MRTILTYGRVLLAASLILSPLCLAEAAAQTSPFESPRTFGDDASAAWDALGHTLSSPGRWDSSDWLLAGLTVGGATGAVFIEEEFRELMLNNRSGTADALERVGRLYGSPIFTAPLSLATYGLGAAFDSDGLQDTGLLMTEVLLSALLVQQPVRIGVGRARPATGEGHLSFQPFTFGNDYASFISGHSWSSFGMSNVMARQIDRWWASVVLYSLAGVTALSRTYADKHWLSDIILGSVLGYAVSTTLWRWHNDRETGLAEADQGAAARWLTVSFSI